MKLASVVGGALLLVGVQGALAEERFYPIVGPDGSIRVIRSKVEAAPSAPPASRPTQALQADGAAAPAAGTDGETSAPGPAFAPYDSDEYADSDAVEQAIKAERPRSRFYMIPDSLGQRTISSGGEATETGNEPVARAAPPVPERFLALTPARREVGREAGMARYPGLAACLPERRLEAAQLLEAGEPEGLVIDRHLYTFLGKDRVAAVYRVGSEGLRTLALRSYSRKDSNPAFALPDLAFLDNSGCVTRLVSAYPERLYAATDKRHAMLSAELDVHADENFLLVLAPATLEADAAGRQFATANVGQLKFTLKK